jgi:HEAT repeat protein
MISEDQIRRLFSTLSAGGDGKAQVEWLESLDEPDRAAVVDAMLAALQDPEEERRRHAFFVLQHCWNGKARDALLPRLADPDPITRSMAAIVYARGEGRDGLARAIAADVSHPDPAIAGPALEMVESMYPDLARVQAALARPELREYVAGSLPRYYAPLLSPLCRALLDCDDLWVARGALAGLIEQNDCSEVARKLIRDLLRHPLAAARDLAASFLGRHGVVADVQQLDAALSTEPDPHARAAMASAAGDIRRRNEACSAALLPPSAPSTYASAVTAYHQAVEGLQADGDPAARQRAFELYCTAEPCEPCWYFQGKSPPADFLEARRLRAEVQRRLFVLPGPAFGESRRDRSGSGTLPAAAPTAPIRDYPGQSEASFGEETDRSNRPFTRLVHVGDDIGWGQDHLTVVAVGEGIVREVAWLESWGNLVVVEFAMPAACMPEPALADRYAGTIHEPVRQLDGTVLCCALYAHLDPFVCVQPGERIEAGRKIGSVGRAFTWDNGGYPAHLHFAVHLGPYWQRLRPGTAVDLRYEDKRYRGEVVGGDSFSTVAAITVDGGPVEVVRRGNWLCGYVARWFFDSGVHGWLDPRRLINGPS